MDDPHRKRDGDAEEWREKTGNSTWQERDPRHAAACDAVLLLPELLLLDLCCWRRCSAFLSQCNPPSRDGFAVPDVIAVEIRTFLFYFILFLFFLQTWNCSNNYRLKSPMRLESDPADFSAVLQSKPRY
jgi:hypothetical protein